MDHGIYQRPGNNDQGGRGISSHQDIMSEMAGPTSGTCDTVSLELTVKAIKDRLPGIFKGIVDNTGQHGR
jgi:hypothetical protein